jgi:signal transduction histidine kinase
MAMPLHQFRTLLHQDTNSLLAGGLLVFLLLGYVALAYVGVIVLGALLLGDLPNPTFSPSVPLNLTAIAVTAFGLLPVSRWLRVHVDYLVYAEHDDPYLLISKVNQQLQAMTSPQLTLPGLSETIAAMLKLPYVAIDMPAASGPAVRIAFGAPLTRAAQARLPIAYLDKPMGELIVSARGANQSLSESDLTLLRDIAQQLGIALNTIQLTADLQASRERLIIAREEERRRIRNDLHDGLAPTLSSLQLQLGAMRNLIHRDPDQAEAIANDLREDLRGATAEIRQLVYDLRPPLLDEFGLVGALKHSRLPGSELNFEVHAPDPMPALSAALEVAVYRIASEAIHNVVKHARATACQVCIEVAGDQLILRVLDNGQSLPPDINTGIGLQSMKERAAELGGLCTIEPVATGGTLVTARFPFRLDTP